MLGQSENYWRICYLSNSFLFLGFDSFPVVLALELVGKPTRLNSGYLLLHDKPLKTVA